MTRTLIDAERVSELTGLSHRALRRRRDEGQEPISFRLGRKVVYDEADVVAWVERQREEGLRRVRKDPTADERINAWVQRNLDNAPDLTVEQRDLLRRVLRTPPANQSEQCSGVA